MNAQAVIEKLKPWIERQRRAAWKPIVEEREGPAIASKFGGAPWVDAESPWPNCGICQRPLTHFLQLNLAELPPALECRFGAVGLLQLFYCTRDECQGSGGWEPFADDLSRVRIVWPGGETPAVSYLSLPSVVPFPEKRIVDWRRMDDYPMPEEFEELGLSFRFDFTANSLRLNCPELPLDTTLSMSEFEVEQIATSETGDKLAGWPYWIQGVEYPHCPRCGRRMLLVFQIDSEDNIPFMWGDCGVGHITQCPEHHDVVAFGWACS
jgi:uncharacterized protein YwqG